MPLSTQIAKVGNATLDVFGLLGPFNADKNSQCEEMEYLNDVHLWIACIPRKWEEYCFREAED
jgi:hypothetical protein